MVAAAVGDELARYVFGSRRNDRGSGGGGGRGGNGLSLASDGSKKHPPFFFCLLVF